MQTVRTGRRPRRLASQCLQRVRTVRAHIDGNGQGQPHGTVRSAARRVPGRMPARRVGDGLIDAPQRQDHRADQP